MAAVVSPALIDPARSGKYPITISEALLREDGPRKRQKISVQYNHKPKVLNAQHAILKPSRDDPGSSYNLSIRGTVEGGGTYKYKGTQRSTEIMALVYDSAKQAFVLDRVDTEFRFNLRSTPANKDAASLATQYPQLESRDPESEEDGLFGGEDNDEDAGDAPADPANPYDYRHFLKRGASPSPEPSIRSSPVPKHVSVSSPPLSSSTTINRPRSRTEPKKPSKKRGQYLSPVPAGRADTGHEDSDPNELVIDMGDAAPKSKPWRSALGVLNEGGRSSGPISLRSAASSMSPSVQGQSEDEEEDDKSDHDVEEIDLEDAQVDSTSRKPAGEEAITNGVGWDDDDDGILQAELEQALEEQAENDQRDQGNVQVAAAAESSSESEEE